MNNIYVNSYSQTIYDTLKCLSGKECGKRCIPKNQICHIGKNKINPSSGHVRQALKSPVAPMLIASSAFAPKLLAVGMALVAVKSVMGIKNIYRDAEKFEQQKEELKKKPSISNDQLNKIVYNLEANIRNNETETGIIVDPRTGSILQSKGGGASEVQFGMVDTIRMKGAILTHNHPVQNIEKLLPKSKGKNKGTSFSPADIALACSAELSEIRAVSEVYKHSLKPPTGGWNSDFYRNKVKPSYEKNEKLTRKKVYPLMKSGQISVHEGMEILLHEPMVLTAKETGMKYTREAVK